MKEQIKVVLVDDHTVVRQGTREILQSCGQFNVVGELASAEGLVDLLTRTQPDLLLLDLNLPQKHGFEVLQEVRTLNTALKVVLFSAYSEPQYIQKACTLKANGFLPKTLSNEELIDALKQCVAPAEGAVAFITSHLEDRLKSFLPDMEAPSLTNAGMPPKTDTVSEQITPREREILVHLALGKTNRDIARDLYLSVKTVDTHVSSLIKKTSVKNRSQLTALAISNGLVYTR